MAKKAADLTDEELNAELGKLVPAHKLSDAELNAELSKLTGGQSEAAPSAAGPKTSAGSTALESFGKGLTANYLPNLQAMVEPITDRAFSLLTGKKVDAAPLSQMTGLTKEYAASRDQNIARQALQQQEHPGTALAGNLAGNLVTGIAASGALPAATTLAGRAAQGIGAGLAQAGLSNPGQAPGEITLAQPGERLANVIQAAPYAIGGTLAAEGLAASVNPIQKFLNNKAEKSAFKSLGPYSRDVLANYKNEQVAQKAVQDAIAAGEKPIVSRGQTVNKIGRTLLDEGIVGGIPKSYETLAAEADAAKQVFGKRIGEIIEDVDKFGQANNIGVDKAPIAHVLKERLIGRINVPGSSGENQLYNDLIGEFEKLGPKQLGIKEAQAMKTEIGNKYINWDAPKGTPVSPKELFYRSLYDELGKKIESVGNDLSKAANSEIHKEFLKAKNAYGGLSSSAKIANKRNAKEFANRFLSPSTIFTGGTGAAVGFGSGEGIGDRLKRAAVGSTAGLVNSLGKNYGNQILATGFNNAANIAGSVGRIVTPAITANPIAAQAVIQNLINESPLQRRMNKGRGK